MISAIYKITNKIDGKFYIGSSNDVKRRWRNHKSLLERNIHHSTHLQNSYKKYGKENFIYEIVKKVEAEHLIEEEQDFFDKIILDGVWDNCYNMTKTAGAPMKGLSHTEETKQVLRKKLSGKNHPHYGKPVSFKWKRNISKSRKRFTDKEERSFRERWERGESKYSIAKSVGVHQTTIKRAIDRAYRFGY